MTLNPGPHRVGLACLGLLSGPAFIPADVILLKRLWLTYIRKKTIILRAVEATGCLNYGIIVIGIIDIIDSPSFTCSFKLYLYINFIAHRARIPSDSVANPSFMTAFFRISKGGPLFRGWKTHRRTANADFEMSFFLVLVVGVSCLGGGLPDVHGSCCDHFP